MDFNKDSFNKPREYAMISQSSGAVQVFMGKVYAWMAAALVLTGSVAYFTAHSETLLRMLFSNSMTVWILFFATLGLVFTISGMINRISAGLAAFLFILYSALMGLMLSSIFIVYTKSSIASVFFITAGMFAVLSVFGMVTKRDLTGMGRFMFMGLIGIIIASIVNFFLKSPSVYWVVSYLGVFIFAGLTAYDTQKLKNMAYQIEGGPADMVLKMSIVGALTLYLDFINMFLFLLRIFGNRN